VRARDNHVTINNNIPSFLADCTNGRAYATCSVASVCRRRRRRL